ncbi:hypothetical protein [Faucicola boevrei]|uniref:hypothetical protein n=1 Tax=Faucicola boevrei TaxID=346665 RepID=UPI0003791842|nr:hypothetical protein [Moraxella boevrei]
MYISELAFIFMMVVFLLVTVKLLDTIRQISQDKKAEINDKDNSNDVNNGMNEKRYCKECKDVLQFFDKDICQICNFQQKLEEKA